MLVSRSLKPISFMVGFDSQGGSSVSLTQKYNVGDQYSNLPSTTYSAHKFIGWKKNNVDYVENGDLVDYYARTLSATWATPTMITWDAATNGGTTGSTTGMYWYAGYPFEVLPDAEHNGGQLTFGGWYTAASGGTKIGVNDVFSGSQTTFYAQFVSYNDPIGNVICPTQNITFTNSESYPWSFDQTTGVDAYKCYQDIAGNYSVLYGTFTGSGTLEFDVYCDTEKYYDGMYVIVDDSYFYSRWQEYLNWDTENTSIYVDGTWMFSGAAGWVNNCQIEVNESGQHNVYFVFSNDANDGNGNADFFDKSAVLVKNVRFY